MDWEGLGTSLVAVVAGDISRDPKDSYETLLEISKAYKHVIFVDGNHEHGNRPGIQDRSQAFSKLFDKYRNITYLHRTSVILDNTAFVGCNGWWTYNFMSDLEDREAFERLVGEGYDPEFLMDALASAKADANHLQAVIETVYAQPRIDNIVVITHTAPLRKFVYLEPTDSITAGSRCGSSLMEDLIPRYAHGKVKAWCFGHVHHDFDETIEGIRFICHPRGRSDDMPWNRFYYPKQITL